MLLVPDITAGTGTEFEETLVGGGSASLSQSEGAQERVSFPSMGIFPSARPSGSRPILDLHYGVRQEDQSKSSSEPPLWPLSEMTVYRPECRNYTTSGCPTTRYLSV